MSFTGAQNFLSRTREQLHVELDWHPVFVFVPRRTISGKWCWGRCYQRVIWCYDYMQVALKEQYGDLFDVISNPNV